MKFATRHICDTHFGSLADICDRQQCPLCPRKRTFGCCLTDDHHDRRQCVRPQRSRQQRRHCVRPQRSRQHRRHDTSVKTLKSARMLIGSGATGTACVVADVATKIKPATAIANVVRSMCFSFWALRSFSSLSTQLFDTLETGSSWTEVQFGTHAPVRFGPKADVRRTSRCPLSANSRHDTLTTSLFNHLIYSAIICRGTASYSLACATFASLALVPGMISKRGSKSTMVEASCFKMLASPRTFAVPSAI